MKVFYDLHIHTALSPCADDDMTPHNIINMAIIKGLDIIAITDHNSSENCEACINVAEGKDLLVIPGMEIQTKEEVHLLCLFEDIKKSKMFDHYVKPFREDIKNNPEIFGNQIIFNENDEIVGQETQALISSVNISIFDVFEVVESYGGLVIPAHIDRSSFSIISNLGFLPKKLVIPTVELSKNCENNNFLKYNSYLNNLNIVRNSDAHRLVDINERTSSIDISTKTIESFLKALKYNQGVEKL